MYVSKSMTFPTPHIDIAHLRHGFFLLDAKPSEKDHDLPGIRTWDRTNAIIILLV
jgi:hypothetical protein